jgi:hypothetical protein
MVRVRERITDLATWELISEHPEAQGFAQYFRKLRLRQFELRDIAKAIIAEIEHRTTVARLIMLAVAMAQCTDWRGVTPLAGFIDRPAAQVPTDSLYSVTATMETSEFPFDSEGLNDNPAAPFYFLFNHMEDQAEVAGRIKTGEMRGMLAEVLPTLGIIGALKELAARLAR